MNKFCFKFILKYTERDFIYLNKTNYCFRTCTITESKVLKYDFPRHFTWNRPPLFKATTKLRLLGRAACGSGCS